MPTLLIDVFIWVVAEPERLRATARRALSSRDNAVIVSAVTPWEISIKCAVGRLQFPLHLFDQTIAQLGYGILSVLPAHGITTIRSTAC